MNADDAYRRFPRVAAAVVAIHFAGLGVLAWTHRLPLFVPPAAAVVSTIAYFTYASDKRRAQRGDRRIPERVLHGLELLGGWPGALFAQRRLRHKNKKLSFQLVFWLIVAVHGALEALVARGR